MKEWYVKIVESLYEKAAGEKVSSEDAMRFSQAACNVANAAAAAMRVPLKGSVEALCEKARTATKSEDAMRFSQAACNAANAMNAIAGL